MSEQNNDWIARQQAALDELRQINRELKAVLESAKSNLWLRKVRSTLDEMITEVRHDR